MMTEDSSDHRDRFKHSALGFINAEMQQALHTAATEQNVKAMLKCSAYRDLSGHQRSVVADIASLKSKAVSCFGDAPGRHGSWWVNRLSLQQSTAFQVAKLKAAFFGNQPVADVCCGLGGDLMAFAARGPAVGIDSNEDVLAFCDANLQVAGLHASLILADATTNSTRKQLTDNSLLHIDPDRRDGGTRHTHIHDLVPDWEQVSQWLADCQGSWIKLAPATNMDEANLSESHRTWISLNGSVREQGILSGLVLNSSPIPENTLRSGTRSAIALRRGDIAVFQSSSAKPDDSCGRVAKPLSWMIELDPAVRAAGLTEAFACQHGLQCIGTPSGFLTSDSEPSTSTSTSKLMTLARVREVTSSDHRKLRRTLRSMNAYPDRIKVRGADANPAKLQKELRSCGEEPVALWIGRSGKSVYAVITDLPN